MKKIRIPIGIKLNTIISSILIFSFAIILYFASQVFKKDNRNNINSLNANIAEANAQKVRICLEATINDFVSMAKTLLQQNRSPALLDHYFQNDSYFSISLFKKRSGKQVLKSFRHNPGLFSLFDIDPKKHKETIKKMLPDFMVSYSGETKIRTGILTNNLPIFYIGIPFAQDDSGNIISIIIGAINQSKILKMFREQPLFVTYLLDGSGTVIAHPNPGKVIRRVNYSSVPMIKSMIEKKVATGQREFIDENGKRQIGAYSTVGISDISVISQVSGEKAFEASNLLIKRSLILSIIVLIFSIILIYIFSGTITVPLSILVKMTKKISKGKYDIKLRNKSHDEIGDLGIAFEKMALGLRQRERLKTTFGKFVNKDLAKQALVKEIKPGGERKEAIIFFSDIRGFTGMSEKMEPEKVLALLNEYLGKMVQTITTRKGVVNKFVGDAIMAVWGIPIPGENDSINAVMACLEMRKALFELNKQRISEGHKEIRIGMAINAGPVISGNMGTPEKMEYTVLGDAVNLTARIEDLTRELKCDFLITHSIYKLHEDRLVVVPAGEESVKGRKGKIPLYKVIGILDEYGKLQNYTGDPYLRENPDRDKKGAPGLFKTKKNPAVLWHVKSNDQKFGPLKEFDVKVLFSGKDEDFYYNSKIFTEGYIEWMPPWHHRAFDRRELLKRRIEKEKIAADTWQEGLRVGTRSSGVNANDDPPVWYITAHGEKMGPMTEYEVKELFYKNENFYNHAMIFKKGYSDWMPPDHHTPFEISSVRKELNHRRESENSENNVWFIAQKDQHYGPFSLEEIERFIMSATITGNDILWQQGWDTWRPVNKIPELTGKSKE